MVGGSSRGEFLYACRATEHWLRGPGQLVSSDTPGGCGGGGRRGLPRRGRTTRHRRHQTRHAATRHPHPHHWWHHLLAPPAPGAPGSPAPARLLLRPEARGGVREREWCCDVAPAAPSARTFGLGSALLGVLTAHSGHWVHGVIQIISVRAPGGAPVVTITTRWKAHPEQQSFGQEKLGGATP